MLLSISGLDFITSISGAASSISNVGPGLGDIIGPNGNYKDIPDISKLIRGKVIENSLSCKFAC